MFRFEQACHTERRDVGELSVDRFGDLWAATQTEMLGDAVEVTDHYRSWWSYSPHFIATPGYVYAYAYGQLLAQRDQLDAAQRLDALFAQQQQLPPLLPNLLLQEDCHPNWLELSEQFI
jgi:hypothetical protein